MTNPKYHIRTYLTCSVTMKEKINKLAKELNLSRCEFIRRAVERYVDYIEKKLKE